MAKFYIEAEVVTYCHLIVEASSTYEALQVARDTDGGDFITDEGGKFNILEHKTKKL